MTAHQPARRLVLATATVGLAACSGLLPAPPDAIDATLPPYDDEPPPAAPREFRGVWVATVANIDWPSRPGLGSTQQQAEITAILDRAQALKLNAIVLQVRPSADAIYPSALEPWSEYLSGEQGKAPEPPYDPLALWIEQAHARGLELHAWINPYRARHAKARSPVHASHIARTHPEAVKPYGDSLWMDPAEPAARQRTLEVVSDIVLRYDVDGIHIDDYFYPYPVRDPETFEDIDFPDGPSWSAYIAAGGTLARADWRRAQVNHLIEALYQRIHALKPWVRFGISPFGLGRPDRRAPGIAGFSQYDAIYADAETWLDRGWLDYLAPQLYWPIDQKAQAFGTLLDTWVRDNTTGRHIWPGLFTSRIDSSTTSWQPDEIVHQIALIRAHPGASGHIHFSMVALLQDRKRVSERLRATTYASAALVPPCPWLQGDAPGTPQDAPRLELVASGTALRIQTGAGYAPRLYAVWRRAGTVWHFSVQPAAQSLLDLGSDPVRGAVNAVVVSAVDRVGREGPRVAVRIPAVGP